MISRPKDFFVYCSICCFIPNGLITDFNKGNPDFNSGAKNLKNTPFCILVNRAFENLISVDAILRLKIYLLVNNNL